MSLTDQALVAHLQVHLTAPGAYRRLREKWEVWSRHLGMERPAAGTGLPEDLPRDPADLPAHGPVAARLDLRATAQIIVHRRHELLLVAVALGAPREPGATWRELDRRWARTVGDADTWSVGETRLYLARGDVDPDELRDALPVVAPLGPAATLDRPRCTLREIAGGADDRRLRHIVAVYPDDDDAVRLELWAWTNGTAEPTPFARYLAHAARVRHQLRMISTAPPAPDVAAEIQEALRAGDADLAARRQRLLALVAGPGGVGRRIIVLRRMARNVQIAASNMAAEATRTPGATGGLFADDAAVARWGTDRLADAIGYLELDREQANEVLSMSALRLDTLLQRDREAIRLSEERTQRRQARVDLLQTSVIGAIVVALAAVQSLDYHVRVLARPAVPAFIAVLGALALWLSMLVLALVGPGERWPSRLGRLSAGLLAAATGWLGTAVVGEWMSGRAASPQVTWLVMVPAFAVGWALMRTATRGWERR